TSPNVTFLNGPSSEELQSRRDRQFSNNLRILNPNGLQNPYSHQFSLGYQKKLNDEQLFIFDAVHTRTNNLYVIRNLNSASSWTVDNPEDFVVRPQVVADSTRPVPIYRDAAGFYALANDGQDT